MNHKDLHEKLCTDTELYEKAKTVLGLTDETMKSFSVSLDEKGMMIADGYDTEVFNESVLKDAQKGLLICSNLLDAMTFYQNVSHGVVSLTQNTNLDSDTFVEKFKGVHKIYICMQNNERGYEKAEMLARKLGFARCWHVLFPKDAQNISDFFKKGHTKAECLAMLSQARRFPEINEEGITHIRDILPVVKETLINGKKIRGVLTGYDELDCLLEGCRPGDLITVAGKTGAGKTNVVQNFAMNIARSGGEVMFFSLEMLPSELVQRLVTINTDVDAQKYAGINPSKALSESDRVKIDATISSLKELPIFFYTGDDDLTMQLLNDVATNAVKKYNAQAIFIDHLHFFARGDAKIRSTQIGDIVREIKMLARRLNVPIFLVSHVRKTGDYSTTLTVDDLRDSSFIGQDSDIVILLDRNKEAKDATGQPDEAERMKLLVNVAKNRHGKEGYVQFQFISKNMKLVPMGLVDDIHQDAPVYERYNH